MPRIDLQEVQQRLDRNLPPHSEQPQSENPCDDPNHPIWELWERMGEMYGHQWHSQQGDEPNDTWARGLSGITPEQFHRGFNALLGRVQTWPPNLAEFRQLCTGHDPDAWRRQAHKPFDESRALENKTAKEAARQAGADALAEMRRTLEL